MALRSRSALGAREVRGRTRGERDTVDARHAARAWLASEAAAEVPPEIRDPLVAALAAPAPHAAMSLVNGTIACFLPHGANHRRVVELDRGGTLVSALVWNDADLAMASVRLPDRSWVTIEPGATTDAPWGRSDRLWQTRRPCRLDRDSEASSVFAALDYSRITTIPPLAEPARLPPGAGTAVLNLVASLAGDQRCERLAYGGAYPTEALFLALLESFRYETSDEDPLAAFLDGRLAWRPAPHERLFERHGAYVQLRSRVEKVVWERRTYYRPDWQSVRRHAPRRVHDVEGDARCSLWALGGTVEDHLRLAPDGAVQDVVAPVTGHETARALSPDVVRGVVERIVDDGVPALAPSVRALGDSLTIEIGPVDRDLARLDGDRARVSTRLVAVFADRLGRAADERTRSVLGLGLLQEIASLLGDAIRTRAQALLATRPRAEQEAALALEADPEAGRRSERVRRAVAALVADQGARVSSWPGR